MTNSTNNSCHRSRDKSLGVLELVAIALGAIVALMAACSYVKLGVYCQPHLLILIAGKLGWYQPDCRRGVAGSDQMMTWSGTFKQQSNLMPAT